MTTTGMSRTSAATSAPWHRTEVTSMSARACLAAASVAWYCASPIWPHRAAANARWPPCSSATACGRPAPATMGAADNGASTLTSWPRRRSSRPAAMAGYR